MSGGYNKQVDVQWEAPVVESSNNTATEDTLQQIAALTPGQRRALFNKGEEVLTKGDNALAKTKKVKDELKALKNRQSGSRGRSWSRGDKGDREEQLLYCHGGDERMVQGAQQTNKVLL